MGGKTATDERVHCLSYLPKNHIIPAVMKTGIHPKWNNNVKVTCSCGASFETGSVLDSIHVDICSKCHPFYTGEMRFVDVQGRVEKFQAKLKKGESYRAKTKSKKAKSQEPVKSLKDMLKDIKAAQKDSE